MSVTKHRLRRLAAVALVATVTLGAAVACGKDDGSRLGPSPTKLIVDTFGEFGYEELVKQYEADTGIKVELRKTATARRLPAQAGPLPRHGQGRRRRGRARRGHHQRVQDQPGQLGRPDAARRRPEQPSTCRGSTSSARRADGRLIGLPTDVGSLAVCYRRDLFQAAACRPSATPSRRCGPPGTSSSRPRRSTARPPARACSTR